MASHQQARKQSTKGREEDGHGARGQQQGQAAMNLEEIGKYRAEAQQRSVDAIRAAEERFDKANQQGRRAHGTTQAPGATVISHQAGTKQQEESHGQGGGVHAHAGTEAKQWLADTASDARERCNRAMGVGTNPTAAQGSKGPAAGKETTKSSTEQEGHAQLTRQGEMGHGRDADKVSDDAEAARAAVEKHDRSRRHAGATTGQHQSAKDTAAKTKEATQQATGTAVDYAKQTAWKAKDVTAGAAGTTADYAKQATVKAKDVTASTGATAAEYARAAAEKAKEAAVATAKTTAGYTQQAAVKAKDATVATGARAAQKATELTAGAAHRVAEYAREKAEHGKEAAARAADRAEEPGSEEKASVKDSDDLTGRRRHEDTVSGDVASGTGGTAEKAKDATGSVAQKASEAAGRVKDAAGGVEQRSRETAGQAGDMARDTASHAENKAGEAKHTASSVTSMTRGGGGGGATARAKGGDDGMGEEEGTTIVGDVLEAVGATVLGLAQHTKGIIAGEEEVVPGDVVGSEDAKKVAGDKEEKRKTA